MRKANEWGKPMRVIEQEWNSAELIELMAFENLWPQGELAQDLRVEAMRAQIAMCFEEQNCLIVNMMKKKGEAKEKPKTHKLSEFHLFDRMDYTKESREKPSAKPGSETKRRKGSGSGGRVLLCDMNAEEINRRMTAFAIGFSAPRR